MPNFYTNSASSTVSAEQWFPSRPVTGVIQPHEGIATQFAAYITLSHPICGQITAPVAPGDWIVIASTEETFLIKDHVFKTMHRPVDDEAAIALGWENLDEFRRCSILHSSKCKEKKSNG